MGLSKSFGSPNGAMRRGWNGITISRDTIHIDGIELGYKNRVLFERHAVGGEENVIVILHVCMYACMPYKRHPICWIVLHSILTKILISF